LGRKHIHPARFTRNAPSIALPFALFLFSQSQHLLDNSSPYPYPTHDIFPHTSYRLLSNDKTLFIQTRHCTKALFASFFF
ncbi:MAG: hypothetical protein BYD32DRAFT_489945, partial [Podila humilis]